MAKTVNRVERRDPEGVSRGILRKIALLDPYADSNPAEVEERLRNMSYGATNSRVSKIRRGEYDPASAND